MEPLATPAYPTGNMAYGGPAQSQTMTVGDWLITTLISAIPVVGFIMLFVWAFGSSTPPSKANWAKATLIIFVIFIALGILFGGSLIALLMSVNPNYRAH